MIYQPEDDPDMAECIACMVREAAPGNGGLCTSCAPPLKLIGALAHRIILKVHQAGVSQKW